MNKKGATCACEQRCEVVDEHLGDAGVLKATVALPAGVGSIAVMVVHDLKDKGAKSTQAARARGQMASVTRQSLVSVHGTARRTQCQRDFLIKPVATPRARLFGHELCRHAP